MKLIRDKMNHADPTEVAMATTAIFDAIQKATPEVRALALASALSIGIKHMGQHPGDVLTAAGNLREGAERLGRSEFNGIEHYLRRHWQDFRQ